MAVFRSIAYLFMPLGNKLWSISRSLRIWSFPFVIKLLFSFLFYWRLRLSFSLKLSFKLFLKFSIKRWLLRTRLKGMIMLFLGWKSTFKYFRLLISLFWFIYLLVILFLSAIVLKYLVSIHNFMKDIFGLFISNSKRGSSFLSGWYFNAISRKAFLISFLFAFLLTPRTS